MNLVDVIESLVEERDLEKEKVIAIVCEGVKTAYAKKYPHVDFVARYNKYTGQIEIFALKEVVAKVEDHDFQVALRRAGTMSQDFKLGDIVEVPFEEKVGRIEILAARQVIANKIRELEQSVVFAEFKSKESSIIAGMVHKKERAGYSIKIGEVMALLPQSCTVPGETIRVGSPIRALLKEVLPSARGDYQLILDRASADFVQKLLELEIPEVFEGLVEIKKIARNPGYKTKVIVASNSNEIDPVGTCVGVGGARIKPILRELGKEKIDLIEATDNLEQLVEYSLKPAEIDKVEIINGGANAIVWLAQDQRSYAIGKMGQNIALASRLTGIEIQLQDIPSFARDEDKLSFDEPGQKEFLDEDESGYHLDDAGYKSEHDEYHHDEKEDRE